MFQRHTIADGAQLLVEVLSRPTVYMDNWALNDFATTAMLRSRFVAGMKRTNGTLRISISNIVELLKQSDQGQITEVLRFLDSIDTGFINLDFKEVIDKENQIVAGAMDRLNPSQEISLIHTHLLAHGWPEHWSVSDVVRHSLGNNENKVFADSFDSLATRMKEFLERTRANPDYMKKSLSRFRSSRQRDAQYCTATRELMVHSLDFILQNKEMAMPAKEWHDPYHTIVPVAYCDIVFLDGRWAGFVSQCGLKPPHIARVFSKRNIEEGVQAVEEWITPIEE